MTSGSVRRSMTGMLTLVLLSCGAGPTGEDIDNSLEQTLQSVNGAWAGIIDGNQATISFTLTQGAGSSVSGSGTMKHVSAATSTPITVTGTFSRPLLSLTFQGMVYEGTTVQGVMQGNYTTVGGISTNIRMTGTSYDKTRPILIYEN